MFSLIRFSGELFKDVIPPREGVRGTRGVGGWSLGRASLKTKKGSPPKKTTKQNYSIFQYFSLLVFKLKAKSKLPKKN